MDLVRKPKIERPHESDRQFEDKAVRGWADFDGMVAMPQKTP